MKKGDKCKNFQFPTFCDGTNKCSIQKSTNVFDNLNIV